MARRVLVADDSPFWRERLRTTLEQDSDCIVFEARSGFEALQKSAWVSPDLAVLDFCMPDLDGLGTARELKRRIPDLPILIVTVDKCAYLEDRARQEGILAVLSKTECPRLPGLVNQTLEAKAA
jgi:CheY-like chemotaxis protein